MFDIAPPIRTRPASRADAALAARWMRAEWSLPDALSKSLEPLLTSLMGAGRVRGGLIEEYDAGLGGWQPVAIGLSVFAASEAIDSYLARPVPFPSLTFLDRAREGSPSLLLGEAEVARANAGEGVNQVTVYYGQIVKDPADPRCRRILPASHKMHREVHGGYRIRRLLQDEWTMNEPVFVSAGYRVLQRFAEGTPCPLGLAPLRQPRTLVGLRAEEAARDLPGTTASFLFEYRKPVLGLTSAERRLLVHATAGFTDQEIASALGLSPNTVKACWRQIYQRFDARAPFVTSDVGAGADDSVRGREKRRHVVAYLADNLQELRPYELE